MDTETPPQRFNIPPDDASRSQLLSGGEEDDIRAVEIARQVMAGGAFVWLEEESDLYDDTSGEPIL